MARFNRIDICEAWHVFYDSVVTKYGSAEISVSSVRHIDHRYQHMRQWFTPMPNLLFSDLTENGKELCLALYDKYVSHLKAADFEVVDDRGVWYLVQCHSASLFIKTRLNCFDDILETFIDFCDDTASGVFCGVTQEDYRDAAASQGYDPDQVWKDMSAGEYTGEVNETITFAEDGLYMVTHTTLRNWNYKKDGMPGIPWDNLSITEITCDLQQAVLDREAEREQDE